MKLSVIVPVYNVHQWLRHCLQSLLEQGLANDYEVILVNDASRDNSQGICSEWCSEHPQFRLINHTENLGLSEARNTGIAEAKGEFITFVDSDDFLAPDTLKCALEDIADADVLEYPVMVNHLAKDAYKWVPDEGEVDFKSWMTRQGQNHCYACNKIYRRELWDGVKFPRGKFIEDMLTVPFVLRKARKIRLSARGLYYYCARTGSISKSVRPEVLRDYVLATGSLLKMPENASNYELRLRYLNGVLTCTKYGVSVDGVEKVCIPLSFAFTGKISWRDRLKVLYFFIRRYF